jgi:hypothetical protein
VRTEGPIPAGSYFILSDEPATSSVLPTPPPGPAP